jgi:hypothetical protein
MRNLFCLLAVFISFPLARAAAAVAAADFCCCKLNKTIIVVISAHARFISAIPILLLGWVFACYGPSAFYLADVIL